MVSLPGVYGGVEDEAKRSSCEDNKGGPVTRALAGEVVAVQPVRLALLPQESTRGLLRSGTRRLPKERVEERYLNSQ